MWYKDAIIDSDWKEIYALVDQWEELANSNVKTAAIGDMLFGLGQDIMRKTLQKGMGYMANRSPDKYGPPAAAMQHYLKGTGEDRKLDENLFTPAIRKRMLEKAVEKYASENDQQMLPPNTPVNFLWDYDDYTSAGHGSSDYIASDPQGDGSDNFSPLRYIVGGFTPTVWYTTDRNGAINVHLKMEDTYDWHGGGQTTYDLSNLGIMNNPKAMAIFKKINNPHFQVNGNRLTISDLFWNDLAEEGMAKPYNNRFEGDIMNIPMKPELGLNKPEDVLKLYTENPMLTAIKTKSLPLMKYLIESGHVLTENELQFAIDYKDPQMVEFILAARPDIHKSPYLMEYAIRSGVVDTVKVLYDAGYGIPSGFMSYVNYCDNPVEMGMFIVGLGAVVNQYDLEGMAINSNWDLFKYAITQNPELKLTPQFVNFAITNNSIDMVDWIIAHGGEINTSALQTAINEDKLDIAKHIVEKYNVQPETDYHLDLSAFYNFERTQNPEALKYVIDELNVPICQKTLNRALRSDIPSAGSPETLDYLLNHNPIIDRDVMITAAVKQGPEIIDKLVAKGGVLDTAVIHNAAYYRNWDLVRYLLSLGIAPDTDVLTYAISQEQQDIIDFILKNKLLPPTPAMLNRAINNNDEELIKELLNLGVTPDYRTIPDIVYQSNATLLRLMLAKFPDLIDTINVTTAIERSTPEIVGILMEYGKKVRQGDLYYAATAEMKGFVQEIIKREREEEIAKAQEKLQNYHEDSHGEALVENANY